MRILQITKRNIDVVILFLFSMLVFAFMIKFVHTDIKPHLSHINKINEGVREYPPNFLYYLIVNFLSGFSSSWSIKILTAIIVLSTAMVSKYVISKQIIVRLNEGLLERFSASKVSIIALALFFCFAIPDPFSILVLKKFYLGKFVPMIWHNSTTIFLFPFAILLFWRQLKILDSSYTLKNRDVLILNALVIANAFIKPSFLFVYIPITFVFLFKKYRKSFGKEFLLALTPIVIGFAIIFIQKFLIFDEEVGSFQKEDSGIGIGSPFKMFRHWMPYWYIPLSFLLSYTLPIYAAAAYKNLRKYKPFIYAVALAIAGILLSAFVYETGPRMFHGNFMWQNIICAHLVFLTTIAYLTPRILDKNGRTTKDIIMIVLLLLHSLSGFIYLTNIALTYNYA